MQMRVPAPQSCTESYRVTILLTSLQEMQRTEEQLNDTKRKQSAMSRMWHPKSGTWNEKGRGVRLGVDPPRHITPVQGMDVLGFGAK